MLKKFLSFLFGYELFSKDILELYNQLFYLFLHLFFHLFQKKTKMEFQQEVVLFFHYAISFQSLLSLVLDFTVWYFILLCGMKYDIIFGDIFKT